jgi:hypothetical protein
LDQPEKPVANHGLFTQAAAVDTTLTPAAPPAAACGKTAKMAVKPPDNRRSRHIWQDVHPWVNMTTTCNRLKGYSPFGRLFYMKMTVFAFID